MESISTPKSLTLQLPILMARLKANQEQRIRRLWPVVCELPRAIEEARRSVQGRVEWIIEVDELPSPINLLYA